jgi:PAS domain S-box-containing protein
MDALEAERLGELMSYGVMDTEPEEAFDRLTALAAELFGTPIALVSLLDSERQWFKSRQGLQVESTDRRVAFCDHAIREGPGAVMVVEDAAKDPRFCDNPLVTGAPDVRFYAGAVLTARSGHALGTLCVIDTQPRPDPDPNLLRQLKVLARIVEDELELRRAYRAANEKRRTLELAEAMAGVGHWRLDVKTKRLTWSDVVYRIHGVTPEIFDPNLDAGIGFYHPEDRATVVEYVRAAIADKGGYQFQLRLNRADGQLRHVTCKAACDLDQYGEVTALFGVFQDVTDHVVNLQEIRTSEAQYRLLAENGSDIIMRTDAEGWITYISPAAVAVTGYSPEQMVGRQWSEFVIAEDAPRVEAAKHAQLTARGAVAPQSIEYRIRHRDGQERWLEGRPAFAIAPGADGGVGVTDVVRDISAHKEDEEELRKARAEAEAAAETKSEFLANMSHELRTPLTAVLGFSALISEQPDLSPKARNYLSRISNAGQVLLATVNDILDFSKLESGQVDIKRRPVDPRDLAAKMLDLFSLQAEQKDLALLSEGVEDLPANLSLDPERLKQVLLNLIGNAIKFTKQGHVRLEARYDDGRLAFAVADTGPGIAREDAERLFRRFSQVDASTTRRYGGTGLGLAICKGLVEAMGGEIGVDTELGKGSRFWISIPAERVGETAETPSAAPAAASKLAPSVIPPGCRVLLAEDNQVNRSLVRSILSVMDVELTEVKDGLEAVEAAMSTPFDVILMDLRMPRLDGVAATRRIRSEGGPNICAPIIAFSADITAQLGVGLFDALVAKPLSPSALIQAMAAVMASQPEMDNDFARQA